jgi:ribonuclease HI
LCVDGGGGVGSSSFVYGVRIKDEDTGGILHTAYGVIEEVENTNNVAEYMAMMIGLEIAENNCHNVKKVIIQGDSQLIMNQIADKWCCSKVHLMSYHLACRTCVATMKNRGIEIVYNWVPRKENKDADELGHKARELFECQL